MKEKIKITGHGFLHNKDYGVYNIEEDIEDIEESKKRIYDAKLDQYRINDQWLIPFHKVEKKN